MFSLKTFHFYFHISHSPHSQKKNKSWAWNQATRTSQKLKFIITQSWTNELFFMINRLNWVIGWLTMRNFIIVCVFFYYTAYVIKWASLSIFFLSEWKIHRFVVKTILWIFFCWFKVDMEWTVEFVVTRGRQKNK